MMSEKTFRSSPFMTPDSLRQKLHLDKAFYDTHTKKYFGTEDINGLQYVGTVENFGSEMLLESRKMRMLRPPLNEIVTNAYLNQYFDLKYADEINTYNQMNMVIATLKSGALLSNNPDFHESGREARIVFYNVKRVRILRSRFDSDSNVVNRIYYETKTPPVLKYKYGTNSYEYPLVATDMSGVDTAYYFGISINVYEELHGVLDGELTDAEYRRSFIDPDMSTRDTLYTIPLTDSMEEIPFIWMCFDSFNTLPRLVLNHNIDQNENPLLEIGTNGHHQSFLYPFTYGRDNLPHVDEEYMTYTRGWSVRVYSRENSFIEEGSPDTNLNTDICKIQFIYGPKVDYNADITESFIHLVNTQQPIVVHEIEIPENEFLRITLTNYNDFEWGKDVIKWRFRHAKSGEWDYDGTLFNNPTYAYLYGIDQFFQYNSMIGILNHDDHQLMDIKSVRHLFEVIFNEDYFDTYEGMTENAVSGIHVDYTSDYSDHGVDKKNGTIYELGDFDGLPSYYVNYQVRSSHRSRVELYTIRDDINHHNQKVTDKQVAALLVDGGIPQYEVASLKLNLKPVIQYDHSRRYITTGQSDSQYNSLTDIAFVGTRHFGDINIPEYRNNKYKMIYHGSRYFSISVTGLNPENYSRVYLITNDPSYYENNETTDHPKSPRTLARICDIPTEYGQLVHLEGISPTFVMDPYYVHSDCDYTIEDQDRIWNLNTSDHLVHGMLPGNHKYVFDANTNLNATLSNAYLTAFYQRLSNLNQYIDMRMACKTGNQPETYDTSVYHWEIVDGGNLYQLGSEFMFFIGGIATKGIVYSDTSSYYGPAEDYINTYDEKRLIHVANLDPRDQIYNTTTTKLSGSGLTMQIYINPTIWENAQPKLDTLLSDLYAFKKDDEGNVWVWYYDETNDTWNIGSQITGVLKYENQYDDSDTRDKRKIVPAIMHNILKNRIYRSIDDDVYIKREHLGVVYVDPTVINVDNPTVNIADIIIKNGFNYQDSYYYMDQNGSQVSISVYQFNNPGGDDEVVMFHKNHRYSEYEHFSTTNEFIIDRNDHDTQAVLQVYSPYIDTIVETSTIGPDLVKRDFERSITFMDVCPDIVQINMSTGTLMKNLYKYDGYQIPLVQQSIDYILESNDVTVLMNYILEHFGEDCEPMLYRNTEFAFTAPMLKNYILQNLRYEPAYHPTDTSLDTVTKLRSINETVVENINGIYKPIGDQPTGAYLELGTEIFNPSTKTSDGMNIKSKPMYLFRIDDALDSLEGFHLIDDVNDIDLSEYTLLLYQNAFYIFNKDADTWIKIIRNS